MKIPFRGNVLQMYPRKNRIPKNHSEYLGGPKNTFLCLLAAGQAHCPPERNSIAGGERRSRGDLKENWLQ